MILNLAFVDENLYQIAVALLLACTFFSVFFLTMHVSKLAKRLQAIETFLKQIIENPKVTKKRPSTAPEKEAGSESAAPDDAPDRSNSQ